MKIGRLSGLRIVVFRGSTSGGAGVSLLEKSTRKGESPVLHWHAVTYGVPPTSRVPWDWSANGW
jgi:hypothetical protein